MSWILTDDGSEYHMDGMEQIRNRIDIQTIAVALSRINRFTGHGARPYSVAEHSLLVCDLIADQGCNPLAQLAALLHDAHEAYVGDLSSPLKWALGKEWERLENRHAIAVQVHFGLMTTFGVYHRQIKQADLVALATERRDLLDYTHEMHRPWAILDTPGREIAPCNRSLVDHTQYRSSTDWQHAFLTRFQQLSKQCEALATALGYQPTHPNPASTEA